MLVAQVDSKMATYCHVMQQPIGKHNMLSNLAARIIVRTLSCSSNKKIVSPVFREH